MFAQGEKVKCTIEGEVYDAEILKVLPNNKFRIAVKYEDGDINVRLSADISELKKVK